MYAGLGAGENAYVQWKSVLPYSEEEVRHRFGEEPQGQAQLIVGLLAPATLLDVLRDYVVYEPERGRLVKKLPRYQQYRAVAAALDRMLKGGKPEERGGVVWAHAGGGQVADDAVAGDEAAPGAEVGEPDDRGCNRPDTA